MHIQIQFMYQLVNYLKENFYISHPPSIDKKYTENKEVSFISKDNNRKQYSRMLNNNSKKEAKNNSHYSVIMSIIIILNTRCM